MKKKKINLIYMPKEFYPNNRVRLNELFMKEFCKLGNHITWIFQSSENKSPGVINKGNNKIIIYPGRFPDNLIDFFMNRLLRLKKYWIMDREIKKNDIDIIVVGDGVIEGFIGWRLSKKHGIPFAYYLSSLFFDFERFAFHEHKTLKNLYKYLESFVKAPLYNRLIRKADIFHPISSAMGKFYEGDNRNIYPLHLCPGEFFMKTEPPTNRNLSKDSFTIISIGMMGEARRMDFLLDVMKKIIEERPDLDLKLKLVGKVVEDSYYRRIQDRIVKLGLEHIVEMKDQVSIKKIPGILLKADIGISILPPFRAIKVSSPTKLVEYMAVGLPVLGNSEIEEQKIIIQKSKGGLLAKYDVDDVVNKLLKAIDDPKGRSDMGKRGRDWIKNNRTYAKMAVDLEKRYSKLIK